MKTFLIIFLELMLGLSITVRSQTFVPQKAGLPQNSPNPQISELVAALNKDSLTSVMNFMVNMGTRYMYAENRREVASGIANKFRGFGYTNVVLDSFRVEGEVVAADSVWQYNVIAEFTGASAPGEIYIIGAHHDNYCNPDPHVLPVPGADDNASGCAVALEIARVLKAKGFVPQSTIRFVTYAAEELTGYTGYNGGMHHAEQIYTSGEDLRLHLNNDMVAYTKGTAYQISGVNEESGKNGWAGRLTAFATAMYSLIDMNPVFGPISESYSFWELGYPVTGFMEYGMTPYYHTSRDSVNHCMMELCLETTKANCAILLSELLTPVPQHPFCMGTRHGVTLSWKQTANANVKKFNIYRSLFPDSAYVPTGQALQPAFSWSDTTAQIGLKYYYRITSEDFSGNKSTVSNTVSGAISQKNRPLLVVKDTKGGFNNPTDSAVTASYHRMFRDLPYEFSDASVSDSLDISILGKYQRIFWLSNSFSDQPNSSFKRHRDEVLSYLRGGGHLFVAGFQPTFLVAGNNKFVKSFEPGDTIYQFYKISEVERKPQALINGALPVKSEYPLLAVDTSRCLKQLPGHLMNVESISPTPDASLIYRWRTAHDSATNQGSMKNRPVGLEYLGDDYKLILLSVPLFYLDSIEAKYLVELVVNDKFRNGVGVPQLNENPGRITGIYPNPARGAASVAYQIPKRSLVSAEVYDLNGFRIFCRPVQTEDAGSHVISFDVSRFSPGLYLVNIKTEKGNFAGKLMVE